MNKIQMLKKLERLPLGTANDIAKITNKKPDTVRKLLYRLCKEGLIQRIEKGKYTVHEDVMIFASYLLTPSYLGLWTALRYYNLIGQQPYKLFVMAHRAKKSITYGNTEIIFTKTKHLFGYKKERYADFDIFMAEKEKAIIDSLLSKLPFEELCRIIEEADIDYGKLAAYAQQTKNITLMKRLGFILEKKKGNAYGLKAGDNNYSKLDYSGKKKGGKSQKWKLTINAEL